MKKPKILLLVGSVSQRSHTRCLCRSLADAVTRAGGEASTWDLRLSSLPICDPSYHHTPDAYPDTRVQSFFSNVRSADGIVLASPLYHGSYSGILKNAIDLLWFDAFRAKAVGMVSHGSSGHKVAIPCLHLHNIAQTLYGNVVHTEVYTTKKDYRYENEEPELSNREVLDRVTRLAQELVDRCIHE